MSDLPDHELNTYLMTVTEALDLAQDGDVKNGDRCLLGGKERSQEAVDEGEPWGLELERRHEETPLRYGQEWGLQVERECPYHGDHRTRMILSLLARPSCSPPDAVSLTPVAR